MKRGRRKKMRGEAERKMGSGMVMRRVMGKIRKKNKERENERGKRERRKRR